jgi:hypothetical protein
MALTRRTGQRKSTTVQPLHIGRLASNNISRPALHITHSVTSDGPDGRIWPPPDDDALWAIVRRANGVTLWRSIQILPSDFPPPADVHLGFGGGCTERQQLCQPKLNGSRRSTTTPKC